MVPDVNRTSVSATRAICLSEEPRLMVVYLIRIDPTIFAGCSTDFQWTPRHADEATLVMFLCVCAGGSPSE